MRFKQIKHVNNTVETTHYIGKDFEVITLGNKVEEKAYIDEVAIHTTTKIGTTISKKLRYLHRDRLGSIIAIVDENGNALERRDYDAFGKPRNGRLYDTKTNSAILQDILNSSETDRGFTDHEHLDDSQLIHMNGRAYDYNLGRFLSVDPFIQEPGNSQSMNPYSYIMNNPLAGTDPSGYLACTGSVIDCQSQQAQCGPYCLDTSDGGGNNGGASNQEIEGCINCHGVDICIGCGPAIEGENVAGNNGSENSSGESPSETPPEEIGSPRQNNLVTVTSRRNSQLAAITDRREIERTLDYLNSSSKQQSSNNPQEKAVSSNSQTVTGHFISGVNDNFITPIGLGAGALELKYGETKGRWSSIFKNHGKYWDQARLLGNYAFVIGSTITAVTAGGEIAMMSMRGASAKDMTLKGLDAALDITMGRVAMFGPLGLAAAGIYYAADYLAGGNLVGFMYNLVSGRREDEDNNVP